MKRLFYLLVLILLMGAEVTMAVTSEGSGTYRPKWKQTKKQTGGPSLNQALGLPQGGNPFAGNVTVPLAEKPTKKKKDNEREPAYGGGYNPTVTNPALSGPTLNNILGLPQGSNPFAGQVTVPGVTDQQKKQPWWQKLINRPPAYGGAYNPTVNNPALNGPSLVQALGLPEGTNPFIRPSARTSLNQALGFPEGINPFVSGMQVTMGEPAPADGGFGTNYGGNWRRRRGGGGYGGYSGYGDGYGSNNYTPGWLMGLNNWNFGE